MITQLFPKDFERYLSLPVLGPWIDAYALWLQEHQYTWWSSRFELRIAAKVCRYLQRRGVRRTKDLDRQVLQSCYRFFRKKLSNNEASGVHVLTRFLLENGVLRQQATPKPTRTAVQLNSFMVHLRDVHGYSHSTIRFRLFVIGEFLSWLKFERKPYRLASLCISDIEKFICRLSKRMGRVTLRDTITAIRSFLRFLAMNGAVPTGLDKQIDTPRIYRQEQLPRSLPWPTVQAFLASINRDVPSGKRDYAMFSLMVTYGLRACDVVALTLDDIQWRAGYTKNYVSKATSFLL